jgi:hypothetical protein
MLDETNGLMRGRSDQTAATIVRALALGCAGFLIACRGGSKPAESMVISTDLPMKSYVAMRSTLDGKTGAQFFFPELDVYGGDGGLVYSGHDSAGNSQVLKGLPGAIGGLHANSTLPRISDVVDAVPAFKARRQELLRQNRSVVLSILLENCHACSVQEDTLGDMQDTLKKRGVNQLVIRVTRP